MRKILIPVLFLSVFACDDDDAPSKTELLTNNSSKSWNLTAATDDDEEDEGCSTGSERNKDNTWVFYGDGKFIFDQGVVTETETCSDLKNITGTWSFQEGETKLRIFALYNTDDPSDTFNDELFTARLIEITAEKFVLELDGEQATFTPK